MPRLSKLVLLPVVLSVAACLAMVPGVGQDSPTLRTGVTQSITQALLDPRLAPGSVFDQNLATDLINKSDSPNEWVKIPSWSVGRWHVGIQSTGYSKNELSGAEDLTRHVVPFEWSITKAAFSDKTGQMWKYNQQNYWLNDATPGTFVMNSLTVTRIETIATDSEYGFLAEAIVFLPKTIAI